LNPGGPRGRRAFFWIAIPLAIHLLVLQRFWFDAPVLDDYDCILHSMDVMARADGPGAWLGEVFSLQNEHRLAGTRIIPQLLAWITGGVDFRLLMLFGTLCMFGVFAYMWREFRDEVPGPIAAGACFLLLQWSYNEALLMGSAATAHLGVVFFAVAGLAHALRPGWKNAAATIAFGVLATYSQANGLFVLPLAGAACLVYGHRRRATVFIAIAVALWLLYFFHYAKPPGHPSPLLALQDPVRTFQLFLIIIGGSVPLLDLAQLVGATVLGGVIWMAWQGLWRKHPTVFLWIAFILVTAAAVAVARVGFGLHHGSRYAVNAAQLMALLVFGTYVLTQPWRPGFEKAALVACMVAWAGIMLLAAPEMRERSFKGRLLVEVEPAGADTGLPRYAGQQHPSREHAARILAQTEAHGWYVPPKYRVELPAVSASPTRPAAARNVGVMDEVVADGRNVILRGWTDYAAVVPQRDFILYPAGSMQGARTESLQVREDVAVALQRPDTLLSGFRIVAQFPSEAEARAAVSTLCVFVRAPGRETTQIVRQGVCG
jgi:hypothetical protein